MEYRVVFYQTERGEKPVAEFLESLRGEKRPAPQAGDRRYSEVEEVFFFFRPGREIVCTNGYVKKAQKLDLDEIARAERYKADWEHRFPQEGGRT